jgi:hypothetical protein
MRDIKLKAAKSIKIKEIKEYYQLISNQPVSDTILNITWNGGDSSASAINGAISLAEAAGEHDVTLWDINNINHPNIDFTTAKQIAAEIALTYRQIMFERNNKIAQVEAANTLDEVESI